jgi:aconitate hydratase
MVIPPADDPKSVQIARGPNIAPLPTRGPLDDTIAGPVLLVTGDNITTDDIMPAGAKILPLRSNIPAISEYVFSRMDPEFAARAKSEGGGFIVGGANYGQGSSREHAALAPMALGVKAVLARSFARIHHTNLVNVGILPLVLPESAPVAQSDELEMTGVREAISAGRPLSVLNRSKGETFEVRYDLTPRQVKIVLAGGFLNSIKEAGE